MESLGKLGLDPLHLVAQVVNFLIIGWVIYRFLLKPLLATMKERQGKIALGLADAEKAKTALEDAEKERGKILQTASAEAYRLLQNARDEAERVRAAALERAARDAERLIAEARGVMELERLDMERAVQALSLRLSGRILEKAVQGLFTDDERARIVARGIERIGTVSPSVGGSGSP